MKKFLLTLGLMVLATGPSQAGLLSDLLSGVPTGSKVTLEDNSRGIFYDRQGPDTEGAGLVSVGDVINGILHIDRRRDPTATPTLSDQQELIVVYSFQVAAIDALFVAGEFIQAKITYVPTLVSDPASIFNLLGDQFTAGKDPGIWSSAAFAVLEHVSPSATNPISDVTTPGAGIIDSITGNSSPYTLDMIGGILSGLNSHGSQDFYDNKITGGPGLIIPAIQAEDASTTLGTLSGGFSVLWDNMNVEYLATNIKSVTTNLTTYHDVTISGGVLFGNNAPNWDYSDKADVNLSVVPVPGTGLLLAGMGGLVGLRRLRRRRAV